MPRFVRLFPTALAVLVLLVPAGQLSAGPGTPTRPTTYRPGLPGSPKPARPGLPASPGMTGSPTSTGSPAPAPVSPGMKTSMRVYWVYYRSCPESPWTCYGGYYSPSQASQTVAYFQSSGYDAYSR